MRRTGPSPRVVTSATHGVNIPQTKQRNPVSLWFVYNPSYLRIQTDLSPKAKAKLASTPGYKFMRRGWIIAGIIILILSAIGRASQLGLF